MPSNRKLVLQVSDRGAGFGPKCLDSTLSDFEPSTDCATFQPAVRNCCLLIQHNFRLNNKCNREQSNCEVCQVQRKRIFISDSKSSGGFGSLLLVDFMLGELSTLGETSQLV